eukprot:TRINITY_DN7344_c0_g1_i1.p1 TRINITY_DN7344_c0_g1~~TRINITY_DN7344_c0_g1_i1.p1  ORF type:complete len:207 (+),score=20.96 TRINITY_DN7344_c0_g1_i1:26-646(+)
MLPSVARTFDVFARSSKKLTDSKIRTQSALSTAQSRSMPRSRSHLASHQTRSYALKAPPTVSALRPPVETTDHSPVEIRAKKAERALYIKWDDGKTMRYPAELLRVESPSAEVQGHGGPNEKRLVWGRKFVNIMGVEPQGNYAILIKFDDLHETGIYSWQYLRWLGENKMPIIRKYLMELKAAGKSRDPRRTSTSKSSLASAPTSK